MEPEVYDEAIEGILNQVNVIFKVKCRRSQAIYFDGVCKENFGDSRALMIENLINFYLTFGDKIEILEKISERLIALEEKVENQTMKKYIRTNDGRIEVN
jgi:hypothetical protein